MQSLHSKTFCFPKPPWAWLGSAEKALGLAVMVWASLRFASYMEMLHENDLWFSAITDLEREISFRTEQGLYYSYFKHLVGSDAFVRGLRSLTNDTVTEHGRSINVLNRFNIYQEVVLASVFRFLSLQMYVDPAVFYVKSVFWLSGFGLAALYAMSWKVTESWVGGLLTAAFVALNRLDATRVYFTVPLREHFSLPFLFWQLLFILFYLDSHKDDFKYVIVIGFLTFLMVITWQFAQYVLLLEAIAVFMLSRAGLLRRQRATRLYFAFLASIVGSAVLQFGQAMLLGSLVHSVIFLALVIFHVQQLQSDLSLSKATVDTVLLLLGSLSLNHMFRFLFQLNADDHMYGFIKAKLFNELPSIFEVRLYLCNTPFQFINKDTLFRLTWNFVLPLYVAVVISLGLFVIASHCSRTPRCIRPELRRWCASFCLRWTERSGIIFLAVVSVFFCVLAVLALRMKYVWVPVVCVLSPLPVVFMAFHASLPRGPWMVFRVLWAIPLILVGIATFYQLRTAISRESQDLKEFWDPDTVELMEWIRAESPLSAAFSGSMQLMAAVKLCTGRPITNHPHFENSWLRKRTVQVYQIYGHRNPKDVHTILRDIGASYAILEDSICLAPPQNGCSVPEMVEAHNAASTPPVANCDPNGAYCYPLFCNAVRYQEKAYGRYFQLVFRNPTFRVYRVSEDVDSDT